MPLCYGIFYGGGAEQWLKEQFQRTFIDIDKFLRWCGQTASFGGDKTV
jgi:hypothetical protein